MPVRPGENRGGRRFPGPTVRRVAAAGGAVLVVGVGLLVGYAESARSGGPAPTAAAPSVFAAPGAGESTPVCPLATLPAEVSDTVRLIHTGGPFPFPRHDGVVFGNREGRLPQRASGYYHEFTVPTPGADTRATRRVVTGGTPSTRPPEIFYTDDHYDSFCRVDEPGPVR